MTDQASKSAALSSAEKKYLRSIGHNLKPVVTVAGKGLSEAVLAEIERAIEDHELIKVKLSFEDREMRAAASSEICRACNAGLVQTIGRVVLVYRKNANPNPRLSNLLR